MNDETYITTYQDAMDALVLAGHACTIAAEWMLAAYSDGARDVTIGAMGQAKEKLCAALEAIASLSDAAKEVDNG
jgi:hypothetical protein